MADVQSRQRLRLSSSSALIVPAMRLVTIGSHVLPVAAAPAWNTLPESVTAAPTVVAFRRALKTSIFPFFTDTCHFRTF